MQPVERVPIESFPGAPFVMQSLHEQGQNGFVDAIEIRFVLVFDVPGIVFLPDGDRRSTGQPTLRLRRGFAGGLTAARPPQHVVDENGGGSGLVPSPLIHPRKRGKNRSARKGEWPGAGDAGGRTPLRLGHEQAGGFPYTRKIGHGCVAGGIVRGGPLEQVQHLSNGDFAGGG